MQEFLSIVELAELLGVRPKTIYTLRARNDAPPAARVGRELRFRRSDIDEWMRARTEPKSRRPRQARVGSSRSTN
jgi:excisionase family DNA binding protein